MKLLRDPLGRPIFRIYFKTDELDDRCERKIADFMDQHCGGLRLPIPTDDLIRLIEMDADDLDMYADLPEDEDGLTGFFAMEKAGIRPSCRAAMDMPSRSDRRRAAEALDGVPGRLHRASAADALLFR